MPIAGKKLKNFVLISVGASSAVKHYAALIFPNRHRQICPIYIENITVFLQNLDTLANWLKLRESSKKFRKSVQIPTAELGYKLYLFCAPCKFFLLNFCVLFCTEGNSNPHLIYLQSAPNVFIIRNSA